MNRIHASIFSHVPASISDVAVKHALRELRADQQKGLLLVGRFAPTFLQSAVYQAIFQSRTRLTDLAKQVKASRLNAISKQCRQLISLKQLVRSKTYCSTREASLRVQLSSVYRDAMRHEAQNNTGKRIPSADLNDVSLLECRLNQLLSTYRTVSNLPH